MQTSDEKLKQDIVNELSDATQINAADIKVAVKGGRVVMEGSVNTQEERRFASKVAQTQELSATVDNHITVKTNSTQDPKTHIA